MQFEEKDNGQPTQVGLSINRRNFIAGIWHGAFLAFGMALTVPTTVISAFVANLTGSIIWVGGLSTVLTVAGALPQLFVARWLEPKLRKLPYLLAAISLRVISWGTLAWLIFATGTQPLITLAWIFVGMLIIFYAGGGLANIPYTDIIGKVIPSKGRGAFFGGKGALVGSLSVGAALLARQILADVPFPNNYAWLFGLAAFGYRLTGFLGYTRTFAYRNRKNDVVLACILASTPERKSPNKRIDWGTALNRVQFDGAAVLWGLCHKTTGCPHGGCGMVLVSASGGWLTVKPDMGKIG